MGCEYEGGLCMDDSNPQLQCSWRIEAELRPYNKCCWVCELYDGCANTCNLVKPKELEEDD